MSRINVLSILFYLIFFPSCGIAQIYHYHPNSPALIGGNFDPTFPGRAYPECLVRSHERAESLLPGQKPGSAAETKFFIRSVSSRQELYRMLNVSLSLSGSYGFFSGDYSGSLEQENTFLSEEFTWVIYGYTNFGRFSINEQRLKDEIRELADDPVAFRIRCGTEYIQIGVRAVQAAAIFTIKNLEESERRILEQTLSASYGGAGLSIGGDAQYREFVQTASKFGQIEVNLHAIGGPGVSALSPIITNVKNPSVVLDTLRSYFENLTLEQSAFVSFNAGSLQSLIGRQSVETILYNRMMAEAFAEYEKLSAERARLIDIYSYPKDWGISDEVRKDISVEIDRVDHHRQLILDAVHQCKHVFNEMDEASVRSRQDDCSIGKIAGKRYDRKFGDLRRTPFLLNYYTTNPHIPDRRTITFSVTGPTLHQVYIAKKVTLNTHERIRSVEVHSLPDGFKRAGADILLADVASADLPIGVEIVLESGKKYTVPFATDRAPQVVTDEVSTLADGPIMMLSDEELEEYRRAYDSGILVPEFVLEGERERRGAVEK